MFEVTITYVDDTVETHKWGSEALTVFFDSRYVFDSVMSISIKRL
jgi:hypothetical protein